MSTPPVSDTSRPAHAPDEPARPGRFVQGPPLRGSVTVPGDKSISHRALMLSALAVGESRIDGLLEGEDVLATAAALRAMGATITRTEGGQWVVHGVGIGGLLQPAHPLDMGNSGTSTRLLMGLIASHAISATFTGDPSLSKRPMGRVIDPLKQVGAAFDAADGGRLPLTVTGLSPAIPISYTLPVASAQVKSAILLAGLNTAGRTEVIEPIPTRDHSERMLAGFGADLTVTERDDGARVIQLNGPAELCPQHFTVPGDPSSAAFFAVAASIVPGSDVTIRNAGLNPTRDGLYRVLADMGADITRVDPRTVGGEPVADLHIKAAPLRAVTPDPAIVPSMVDEFPVLFIAAAMAEGSSTFRGLEELRVKESDRIRVMADGLRAIGVAVEEMDDGLVIHGSGGAPLRGGGPVATHLDHRICMSFAVAGLVSAHGVTIDDMRPVATSFPGFETLLSELTA